MIWRLPTAALLVPALAMAQPWTFDDPITVAEAGTHFHHLDGTGRRHVAVSGGDVAVVWEDDSSGTPQVYVAIKPRQHDRFATRFRLSSGAEAFEPAIVPLGDGRWLAAWEQDETVVTGVLARSGPGPVQKLADRGARQVTLAGDGKGRVAAVWARANRDGQLIEAVELVVDDAQVSAPGRPVSVAPLAGPTYQAYPAAAYNHDGDLLVAWEDRRAGHTRLFHTRLVSGQGFAPERQLNEHFAPPPNAAAIGLGSGVMRVILAVDAAGHVQAIWLDKRNAASGYAVWGAASDDGGTTFGANGIVQDELGAAVAQWHAALAGGPTGFVAAWDDAREGWGDASETGDVLLSWTADDAWSADWLVPGASGAGYQGSPALTLDAQGDLHLLWIDRDDLTAPTRLRYARGRFARY